MAKRFLSANANSKIASDGQTIVFSPQFKALVFFAGLLIRENSFVQFEFVKVDCRMLRGNLALFLALILMSGSFAFAESDSTRGSGIEGVVLVSPTWPGPIKKGSEKPNVAPVASAVFSVFNNKGTVTSFTTDAEGRFRLSLSPGHYVVSLTENRFARPCGPFEIDVEPGKMIKVEWRCDSGMQ